ncbi:MAG: hypothetical protein WD080_02265 [Egibacteraceae bacterium]
MTPSPAGSPRPAEVTRQVWMLVLTLALLASGLSVVARDAAPTVTPGVRLSSLDVAPVVPGAPAAETVVESAIGAVDLPVLPPVPVPVPVPDLLPAPAPEPPAQPAPPPPAPAPGEAARIPLVPAEPRLATFAGLSTWVDLYDVEISPEEQAARAAAGGAQAIFVQTGRFSSPADIHDPARLGRLIEAAHDLGMRVMTWYLPDHLDPATDLRRAQAAISFTTPRGDRPDAFGLDIEAERLADVAERSRRVVQLSAELREWAGPDFPLAAIVLPPLQLDLRPSWWPGFPWAQLRPFYDVYIPMSYSSFRGTDPGTTYRWNLDNILETRVRTGDPNLPIHMAGGIADRLPHVPAFVDALRDGKVLGGGLYDLHTTPQQSWHPLRALRAE